MQSTTIDSAAIRLTETILGHDEPDLEQTLKAIAVNIGGAAHFVCPVVFAEEFRREPDESDLYVFGRVASALFQETIYPNRSGHCSGSAAVLPFDWDELPKDDPDVRAFLDDAAHHDVGRNGLSIPIRNRKGVRSLVSFTSNQFEGQLGRV